MSQAYARFAFLAFGNICKEDVTKLPSVASLVSPGSIEGETSRKVKTTRVCAEFTPAPLVLPTALPRRPPFPALQVEKPRPREEALRSLTRTAGAEPKPGSVPRQLVLRP